MTNKKAIIIISFVILMIFAVSTVNAGIFEFTEDTGEYEDSNYLVDDIDDEYSDELEDDDLENYDIEEFELKISKPKSISNIVSKIKEDEYYDSDTVDWLEENNGYVIFITTDGDFILVDSSESDKIPTSDKYSSCTIECEVVDTNYGFDGIYYIVKNIKVTKKVEKKSTSTSSKTTSSSSKSSSSSSSSSSGKSNANSHQSMYIGNAATMKFHSHICHDVDRINPSNMVEIYSRDDAINMGYTPCGHCRP